MDKITELKVGDSIGIFSPSAPITYSCPNRFDRAKKYLQSKGFNFIEGSYHLLTILIAVIHTQ